MRRVHPGHRNRGFTLLELLVALGIFAVVSVIAYTGLIQAIKARERLTAEEQFWRPLFLTFWRLQDDLSQARPRSVRDNDGAPIPALRGQPFDPRALAAPSLEFTRGGLLRTTPEAGDLQRVGYRLADGVLYRLTWSQLDRATQSEPVASPLLSNVEEFAVRLLDARGQWMDEWPPREPSGLLSNAALSLLPSGLEVRIRFAGHGEFTRLFLVAP